MSAKRYRKIPIEVEACQFQPGMEDGSLPHFREPFTQSPQLAEITPYINTTQGKQYIYPGDYIITNAEGERYVCRGEFFKANYEPIE